MLHVKKDDIVDNSTNITIIKPAENLTEPAKSAPEQDVNNLNCKTECKIDTGDTAQLFVVTCQCKYKKKKIMKEALRGSLYKTTKKKKIKKPYALNF